MVGVHIPTNDLRVFTIKMNLYGTFHIQHWYKSVTKTKTLIDETIQAKCQFREVSGGKNAYDIVFGGSYLDATSSIRNYYVSKFSTKGNFTNFYHESEDPTVNENLKGVYYDYQYE